MSQSLARHIDYGLRSYDTPPTVWGGDSECEHVWGDELPSKTINPQQDASGGVSGGRLHGTRGEQGWTDGSSGELKQGQFCQLCNAWRGSLGLEPDPQMFVDHLVECFREVRRVLRDDGVLFLNLGDSYAGSGGMSPNSPSSQPEAVKARGGFGSMLDGRLVKGNNYTGNGLKPKDLIGIPWRVALALQADGWWLRSAMPWVKGNCMPESVQDRPTTAHEYIFMLAKSKTYFYDGEAVKVASLISRPDHLRRHLAGDNGTLSRRPRGFPGQPDRQNCIGFIKESDPTNRNRRTSDTFRESLDLRIEQQRAYLAHLEDVRDNGGMLTSETGDPVAMLINTRGYSGAHFAVFPPDLVKPMIAAGTSERGACPECGAPWVRVVEKPDMANRPIRKTDKADGEHPHTNWDGYPRSAGQAYQEWRNANPNKTTGWQPTCTCPPVYIDPVFGPKYADPIPCTVLDPFGGAGTTALQADRMGRDAVIIDLNETYVRKLAYPRIIGDAPLFSDVEIIEMEKK